MKTYARALVQLAAISLALTACSTRPVPGRRTTRLSPRSTGAATWSSREGLARTIQTLEDRVGKNPADADSAIRLADALLRQTRVIGNAGLARQAEAVLEAVLAADASSYEARRMLATVYLSEHRFRDAIREADRCQTIRRDDPYVFGVLGDGHLELGEYDAAFSAFNRMMAMRPNAAAYARASYARELQGDLNGALQMMQMAAAATGPQDPESVAWHHAQLGHLYLALGRLSESEREYMHADYAFPGHPLALDGLAHVADARGEHLEALRLVQATLATAPTAAAAAYAGDLLAALGRQVEADRQYRIAEAAWQTDTPDPARLAKFLAEHGRRITDAVHIAEAAVAERRDIFTLDALAWAYFQAGELDKAAVASKQARRTGSRDAGILAHANAIDRALAHVTR
jgi:tetratricopeptide (TPR) repeat protein